MTHARTPQLLDTASSVYWLLLGKEEINGDYVLFPQITLWPLFPIYQSPTTWPSQHYVQVLTSESLKKWHHQKLGTLTP